PSLPDELAVKPQVVLGEEPEDQDFPGEKQMPEVSPRVSAAAARAPTCVVDGGRIILVTRLFDGYDTGPRDRLSVSGVARGEHAIEHVDPRADGAHEVAGCADT